MTKNQTPYNVEHFYWLQILKLRSVIQLSSISAIVIHGVAFEGSNQSGIPCLYKFEPTHFKLTFFSLFQ